VLALRCPACGGVLEDLRCLACQRDYLEVDGIACLSDKAELRREQRAMLAPSWLTQASEVDDREHHLQTCFALAHFPPAREPELLTSTLAGNPKTLEVFAAWIDCHAAPDAPALEVGCGPGGLLVALASRRPAVGLDLRVGMLRLARRLLDERRCTVSWRAEGRRIAHVELSAPRTRFPVTLIQGSLRHCRLEPFPIVVAISLLDVLPEPGEGLRELVRLTQPGGLLLVALPYQYDAEITPRERWWGPEDLIGAMDGFEILEQIPALPWVVPSHERLAHQYALHAVLVRKPAELTR
jgi:SAM-dependent methyltransferase